MGGPDALLAARLAAGDDHALVEIQVARHGKTAAMDLHHLFRFRDGKIAYYRGTEDTAQTARVLQR